MIGIKHTEQFALEHFYFGQRVMKGEPERKQRLLAASAGIKPELVRAAVERVYLPPLSIHPAGSWALMRGNRQLPFLLVQAQVGEANQVVAHYILIPSDVLRSVGGGARALRALLNSSAPHFEGAVDDEGDGRGAARLDLLNAQAAPAESAERQIDDILDLMTLTQNRLDVMERLLAAIIQNVQIIVQGAPSEPEARVNFIEGLLAMLPPSVRFAVTFATHSLPTHDNDAQIRFYSDDLPPAGALVYQWPSAHLSGATLEHDYSRLVISLLRLDPQLVIDRTRSLVPATGWRMRQGDRLAEALTYGSHRLKIDEALQNNQPVSKDDAAAILRDDPTLSPELRALYARHVVTFTLAMNDPDISLPVAALARENPDVARVAFGQLSEAIGDRQAGAVAATTLRWLGSGNGLDRDEAWVGLATKAVTTRLRELTTTTSSAEALNQFVLMLQTAPASARLDRQMPRIIEALLPSAAGDPTLAENTFLLAAEYLNIATLRKVLGMKPFTDQLRPPVRALITYTAGRNIQAPPAGFMGEVGRGFGELWEPLVTARLAELAIESGRRDLIDLPGLRVIAAQASLPASAPFAAHWLKLADALEADLGALGEEGGVLILRIRLAHGDTAGLAAGMIAQASGLYGVSRQTDYLDMVARLFAEARLNGARYVAALEGIAANGIRSAPLLMAMLGSLAAESHEADDTLSPIADQAEAMMLNEPRLLAVIPAAALLGLLDYHARRGEALAALRAAEIVSAALDEDQANPLPTVTQMYRIMARQPGIRAAALDVLRAYVRGADDKGARVAIVHYGRELGQDVRTALEATYTLRRLRGDADLESFAARLKTTVGWLLDTVSAYNDPRNAPDIPPLTNELSRMDGRYQREEQRIVTGALLAIIQNLVTLNTQHRADRPRNPDALISGNSDPVSALDALRVVAGVYSDGKKQALKFPAPLAFPLGGRSRRALLDELRVVAEVLGALARTFAEKPGGLNAAYLRAEAESLLAAARLDTSRRDALRGALATELQILASAIEALGENLDPRIADDKGQVVRRIDTLRTRPRHVLEFYRFLYAYFGQRG